jgi:hypothetical protein
MKLLRLNKVFVNERSYFQDSRQGRYAKWDGLRWFGLRESPMALGMAKEIHAEDGY